MNVLGDKTTESISSRNSHFFKIVMVFFTIIIGYNIANNVLLSMASLSWYSNGSNTWTYRKAITIDQNKVLGGTDLTNFPILIDITDPALATTAFGGKATSGFGEFVFTSSDGVTALSYEIEKYTASTGELKYWVKVPTLSATNDTVLYIYYGSSASGLSNDNKTGVWDTNYKLVQHLSDGITLNANDSTSNANNGVITAVGATTGKIDGGGNFNGTSAYITTLNNVFNPNVTDFTVSVWNNMTSPTDHPIISQLNGTGTGQNWLRNANPGVFQTNINGVGQSFSTVPLTNTMTFITLTKIGTTIRLYVNGVLDPTIVTATPTSATGATRIGGNKTGTGFFAGVLDEVRISDVSRSIGWIATEYNNQNAPGMFYGVGAEEVIDPTPPPAPPLPNIIVIMTDDQRMDEMDVMPKTRSLIGDQGLTFTNSFVDFPLCCPSRASFLTGQAAHNTGILGNSPSDNGGYLLFKPTQNNSLPVWLQGIGYVTAHMGKYLNGFTGSESIPPGWSLWNGIADDQGGIQYYNYTINNNGVLNTYGSTAADYKTDVQTQRANDFISQQQNSSQPFFLWLAPLSPHTKFGDVFGPPDPAPRHVGLFNNMPLPLPPNFNEADMSDKPNFMQSLPSLNTSAVSTITDRFRRRKESLLAVDDMVESVINSLQATGKLDNTYIVFTSDNGWENGEHRRPGDKQVVYEESIRVPLLIRGPGIPAGEARNQLVNNLDLVATIEELTTVIPGRIPDGRSLVPLFQNPATPWRSSLLAQGIDWDFGVSGSPGRFQTVRTDRYKYSEHLSSAAGFEKEFYDLIIDPYELVNQQNNLAYASIIEDLTNRLSILRSCIGSSCWITTPEPPPPQPLLPLTHWRFDENTGTVVNDSSGNNWNGTIIGNAVWTGGKINSGLQFDGATSYITFGDITTPQSLTLESWIYIDSGTNSYRMVMSKGQEYDFRINSNGNVFATTAGTTLVDTSFNLYAPANLNQWYHLVFTFDKLTSTFRLYRNGVQVASVVNSGTIANTTSSLWLGRHTGVNFATFLGKMDEIRIYGQALTSTQVNSLYLTGQP